MKSSHPSSQEVAHTTFFVKTVEDVFIHVGMYHLGILHKSDSTVGVRRIHNAVTHQEITECNRNYKFKLAENIYCRCFGI